MIKAVSRTRAVTPVNATVVSLEGSKLETGAHMAELIRTKAGPFNPETSVTIQDPE